MLEHLSMDQGPSLSASFLTELDLSDGASLLRPAGRVTPKDLILGAGGSTLAHMLVAVAVLLMPTIQPQPMPHGSFVTVNLVERGGSIGGSSDAGSVEGAEGAPQIEASRPSPEKPWEKAPLPDPPKTVKRVERVSSSAGKAVKTGVLAFSNSLKALDSGARRNDEETPCGPFCETIKYKSPSFATENTKSTKNTK